MRTKRKPEKSESGVRVMNGKLTAVAIIGGFIILLVTMALAPPVMGGSIHDNILTCSSGECVVSVYVELVPSINNSPTIIYDHNEPAPANKTETFYATAKVRGIDFLYNGSILDQSGFYSAGTQMKIPMSINFVNSSRDNTAVTFISASPTYDYSLGNYIRVETLSEKNTEIVFLATFTGEDLQVARDTALLVWNDTPGTGVPGYYSTSTNMGGFQNAENVNFEIIPIDKSVELAFTGIDSCGSPGDPGFPCDPGDPGEVPEIPAGVALPLLALLGGAMVFFKKRIFAPAKKK